jgi:hypothetical protein
MVAYDRAPGIRRPCTGPHQIRASGARHGPVVRPTAGFPTHPLDEITQTAINFRLACPIPRFPAQVSLEPRAMPPQDDADLTGLF